MKVLSVILIMVVYSLFMWSPQAFAQPANASGAQSQNHDAAKYWDSVQKQRRVNQCLRRRSGECHKKYQDAVDWCLKNWNEC